MTDTPAPSKILLHKKSKILELQFGTDSYELDAEFLRVHSPSAEVQGHGPGQAILQFGKAMVAIDKLEPTGHYGIRIYFDDGHDTGIYSWEYLLHLARNREQLDQAYESALHREGKSRLPQAQVLQFSPPS
ncbi:MAG: DUF971 domain-containing protein [Candidatus Pelagadaptatus aseana]|uniref:gamma-butyrobetaine hydroxylase-like domain-containing protein n=1 Tax=Candidatus Pelagadaptatus aseana TaxID=3120508 RepID=UPI0039B13D6C